MAEVKNHVVRKSADEVSASSRSSSTHSNCHHENDSPGLLKLALDRTLEKCVNDSFRESIFKRCFRKVYEYNPDRAKEIRQSIVERLRCCLGQETEKINAKHGIMEKLTELDQIKATNFDQKETAWRPSRNPVEDLRAHVVAEKLHQKEVYKKMLQEEERKLEELKTQSAENEEKLQQKVDCVNKKRQHFTEVAEVCRQFPTDDVRTAFIGMS